MAASTGREIGLEAEQLCERFVQFLESEINLDPLIFFLNATFAWITNSFTVIDVWIQLRDDMKYSWWMVFSPTWLYYWMNIPFLLIQLVNYERWIVRKIGIPPSPSASAEIQTQYRDARERQKRIVLIDISINLIRDIGTLTSTILLVDRLEKHGSLVVEGSTVKGLMVPLWLSWLSIIALSNVKSKVQYLRTIGRDICLLFWTMVALKLDNQVPYSWQIIFSLPWIAFGMMGVFLSSMMGCMATYRAWRHLREFAIPFGFMCIVLGTSLHFFTFFFLARALEGELVQLNSIFGPSIVSWVVMWLSAVFTSLALAAREQHRALPSWDIPEQTPSHDETERQSTTLISLDSLTDTQMAALAHLMTQDRPLPPKLIRIGHSLFRDPETLAAGERDAGIPVQPADGTGSLPLSSSPSHQSEEALTQTGASELDEEEKEQSISEERIDMPIDEGCCTICYEPEAASVFLLCGHGLYCRSCANRLLVRPPHECPICRQRIFQIADLASVGTVGSTVDVCSGQTLNWSSFHV